MNQSDTLELSLQLLRQPSVTPIDHTCQTIMADRLAKIGFQIESMRFDDVDNLWARRGTEAPVFCFAGHTDVVPTGSLDAWNSDPFAPEIRDGKLYGPHVSWHQSPQPHTGCRTSLPLLKSNSDS